VARVGRARALWGGLLVVCGGAIAFCATTLLPLTLLAALVCGFAGSLVVNTCTSLLADHHRADSAAAISEANAFAAGFGVAAPLALGTAERWGPGWRAGLLVYLVLVAVLALVLGRVRVPDHRTWSDYDATRAVGSLPAAYWRAWAVVMACVAVEFCLTIWASDVLRSRYALSPGAAAAGVTAVVAGMAVGRAFGGRVSEGRDVDRLLYAALSVCAA
jgi:predicted MFS family arabinose efflux permease